MNDFHGQSLPHSISTSQGPPESPLLLTASTAIKIPLRCWLHDVGECQDFVLCEVTFFSSCRLLQRNQEQKTISSSGAAAIMRSVAAA